MYDGKFTLKHAFDINLVLNIYFEINFTNCLCIMYISKTNALNKYFEDIPKLYRVVEINVKKLKNLKKYEL